jgi:hypothetical protein
MSDQRPDAPWIGPAPQTAVPPARAAALAPLAPPRPVPPKAVVSPLAQVERLANISLWLSLASIFCLGLIGGIAAYVIAAKAKRLARPYGVTSSDGRIRWAKRISIFAILGWVVVLVVIAGQQ